MGGNTTVQEANYLTRFAKKVSIVHRGGQFSAQRIAQERALGNPKIDVLWNTVVTAILGEQRRARRASPVNRRWRRA